VAGPAVRAVTVSLAQVLEARLAHVELHLAAGLSVEGRHVGRVPGRDDHELVRAYRDVAYRQAAGPVGDGADLPAVEEHQGPADVGLHDRRGHVAHQRGVDRQVAAADGAEVDRGRLVTGGFDPRGVRALFETDGAGGRGADVATIDVDVGTAGHARERDGAGTDLTLQVGRDVLRLPGTYRRTRAERVVPGQFEPHVVPARRDAEVEWRDPHERAVDVDVGPAGVRLEGQGAPARLGCLGSYAV